MPVQATTRKAVNQYLAGRCLTLGLGMRGIQVMQSERAWKSEMFRKQSSWSWRTATEDLYTTCDEFRGQACIAGQSRTASLQMPRTNTDQRRLMLTLPVPRAARFEQIGRAHV